MTLLGAPQEVSKKRAKTFPLGTPLASRRSDDERRGFCFCKIPPSWAHISHAQDGFAVGKVFCYLGRGGACSSRLFGVCLLAGGPRPSPTVFVQTWGRSRRQKLLFLHRACYFRVRILYQNANAKSEFAYFRANMSGVPISAKAEITQRRLRARRGVPRGNVLASFLATSWDEPRSSIQCCTPNARGLPRRVRL